jgi:hypothetical protein
MNEPQMTETLTFTIPIDSDMEDKISFFTGIYPNEEGEKYGYADVFSHDCIGYWMQGIESDPVKGWLGWEFLEDEDPEDEEVQERHEEAIRTWKNGEVLPKNYYSLDREMAKKILVYGMGRWGQDFVNGQCDVNDDDVAVQMTLLQEVRYG